MKDQLITYYTADLAKEKEFDLKVNRWYSGPAHHLMSSDGYLNWNWNEPTESDCSAPTQSLLQKWLREEHKIIISSNHHEFGCSQDDGWYYSIGKSIKTNMIDGKSKTYEEALEKGLQEALKLIK